MPWHEMRSRPDRRPFAVDLRRAVASTDREWTVRSATVDNGAVAFVKIDDVEAKSLRGDCAEREAEASASAAGDRIVAARAIDAVGNAELLPHVTLAP